MMRIKRIYEKVDKDDGIRVLVDRLWPRGITKVKAKIDYWMKDIAPSDGLRKWFNHKEERWQEFKIRYFEELKDKKYGLNQLNKLGKAKTITLLYGAKDTENNNARALLEFIKRNR